MDLTGWSKMESSRERPVATLTAVEGRRTTSDLLQAALDGDSRAWRQITEDYSDLLWWIARSYRLDDAASADLVQMVWLKLLQHGRSIRNPERLAAWLATTARREANRRYAASRRQLPTDELEDRPSNESMGPEEHAIDEELTAAALAAFHQLGSSCQQLMALLCEVPPKSYQEISAVLDLPIGSIGPTRQRCLATLRSEMKKRGF